MTILAWPDPALRLKALKVEPGEPGIKKLAEDMIRVMNDSRGVGLAATQVGLRKRLFVIARIPDLLDESLVLVNPEIVDSSGSMVEEEGCLSFPGGWSAPVRRAREVTTVFHDLEGERFRITASGLLARVIQHENDHLDGIVFPDRLRIGSRCNLLRRYRRGEKISCASPGREPGN